MFTNKRKNGLKSGLTLKMAALLASSAAVNGISIELGHTK